MGERVAAGAGGGADAPEGIVGEAAEVGSPGQRAIYRRKVACGIVVPGANKSAGPGDRGDLAASIPGKRSGLPGGIGHRTRLMWWIGGIIGEGGKAFPIRAVLLFHSKQVRLVGGVLSRTVVIILAA